MNHSQEANFYELNCEKFGNDISCLENLGDFLCDYLTKDMREYLGSSLSDLKEMPDTKSDESW